MELMVRYLLDTNLIIDAVGGCRPAVEALEMAVNSDWVGYSAITRLELFGYPDLSYEEECALAAVTDEINELAVTSSIIDLAIRIRKSVRIKSPDAIIAATSMKMNAVLMTRNKKDFKSVRGLKVLNPWTT